MAARQGFEPRLPGSEPGVLPLDDLASSGDPGVEPSPLVYQTSVPKTTDTCPPWCSSGGRDRTHVVTVNNRAPVHSATPESHASTDGAGIEPANRLAAGLRRSRALHFHSATHPVPGTTVKGSSRVDPCYALVVCGS